MEETIITVDASNYHSFEVEKQWLSSSQLLDWQECEARATARYLRGESVYEEETPAMKMGRYLAARWAGESHFREFIAANPDVFRRDGLLKAEFSQCEQLYSRTCEDAFFRRYLQGRHWEILTGELFGLPWKCRIEVYNQEENFLTDLMVCRDFAPVWDAVKEQRVAFYAARRIHLRLGLHQLMLRRNTGRTPKMYLAAVTRQNPPDLKVLSFNGTAALERIAAETAGAAATAERIREIRAGRLEPRRCGNCPYCRGSRLLTACEEAA